jgi:hypothetical protein
MRYYSGLGGHEQSGLGHAVMAAPSAHEATPENLLWLANMQEGLEDPLYLDRVHYTAPMSRRIAAAITDGLTGRLPARSVPC